MVFKNITQILTQEEKIEIKEFAEKSFALHSNQNHRNKESIIKHIIQGKSAEVAFYKMAKAQDIEINKPNFIISTKYGDGGVDFIVNNHTTGVKSFYEGKSYYWKISMGFSSNLECEIYVAISVNDLGEFNYIGCLYNSFIRERKILLFDEINNFFYIRKSYFEQPLVNAEF